MAVTELAEHPTDTLRVELFVRSLAPETARSAQERILERLRELDRHGPLDGVDCYVAGDCVCPSTVAAETEIGQFLLDRIDAFETWAGEHGYELVGFDDRCVDSSMTGETVTGIRFPRLCLAVFGDDNLILVAPVADDETRLPVDEAVRRLSAVDTRV